MGSFIDTAWRCVKWIGNCINSVVSWWYTFMEGVNKLVHSFLMLKKLQILSSDCPKVVGEIVAIKKEKDELDRKADNYYRKLSFNDRRTVDSLLEERNY